MRSSAKSSQERTEFQEGHGGLEFFGVRSD